MLIAVKVIRIATGEEEELDDNGRDPTVTALEAKSSRAQVSRLRLEERSCIAKKAATAR